MSLQASNDSDDSEVSLHSDASDSSKSHKHKKKRSALKEYFSKQIDSEHGRTSPQNKSYSESLFRKKFKRLIHKSEIIQSPTVSYKNSTNHSGSDDENSVHTIFPEKAQQPEIKSEESQKEGSSRNESKSDNGDGPEDIEPAIDALDEIHPILAQTVQANVVKATSFSPMKQENNFKTQYSCIFLMLLLSMVIVSIFIGAPFHFITLIIGVMIPICINIISKKVVDFIKRKLYIQGNGPEKTEFILPKYNEMNILEVPSVEEYQVPKTYEGWINLYPHYAYDPETYHLSDTTPVYIKIKGKHLIVNYTKNHVTRRTTYNEPELKLNITSSVVYNLSNAKVSLLPDGLAKIRHWSKKYPICIEIENSHIKDDNVFHNNDLSLNNTIINQEKEEFQDDCSDTTTTNAFHDNIQEDVFKDVEDYDETMCAKNSVSTSGEDVDTNSLDNSQKEERQRLLLFARANREKYDWYLRILSTINLVSLKKTDKDTIDKPQDDQITTGNEPSQEEAKSAAKEICPSNNNSNNETEVKTGDFEVVTSENTPENCDFYPMGDQQYLKYMGHFLHGDYKDDTSVTSKDFNMSISKDILWFNVLAGRVLLGVLNDPGWIMKIQERIQRKLSTIKLPYYIDELECSELSLGETPPKIHRASKPIMNERGLWVDLDVTYEGLVTLVLSTKLNLMKLKKMNADTMDSSDPCQSNPKLQDQKASAIYNSDLEDSADSSTSEDQAQDSNADKSFTLGSVSPTPRKQNKSFLKVVDQVAASKFFQQATENKYVKKALVAVSNSQLRLQVDFRGLIGEIVLNIPNPPSDRLWFGFRKPPRIWLTVHPAFGERNVNFTYVTNWIEKKICQEIVKNLVLPNMEDLIIPILLPQT